MRPKNRLSDLAMRRFLVILRTIFQPRGRVESLNMMDSIENERRGGYHGMYEFCEKFCYTVEQRKEWMPGVGYVGKGVCLF